MRRFCCGDGWHPSSAHHQLTSSPKKVLLALTSQKQTRPRNCWQGKLAFKNRRFALQISLEDLGDISVFELKSGIRIYLLVWGLDMYWRCSSGSSPMPRQSISRAIHGASAPLPESRCFHRVFYSTVSIWLSSVGFWAIPKQGKFAGRSQSEA